MVGLWGFFTLKAMNFIFWSSFHNLLSAILGTYLGNRYMMTGNYCMHTLNSVETNFLVFTNFESTNPRIFFTRFFLFSFKTRQNFSVEIMLLKLLLKRHFAAPLKENETFFREKKKLWIHLTNPLDGRNTKKLKNQKLKLLIFL